MPQVGTNGNDPETYFNNTDPVIYALDGDDVIRFAGAPVPFIESLEGFASAYIEGGRGNDTIFSGPGNDTVYGGDGDDIIDGGSGINFLDGGNGNDVISARGFRRIDEGGLGQGDTVHGGAGNDTIHALGSSIHMIFGGSGNDTIYGNEAFGRFTGTIDGGDGNDIIYGGRGYRVLGGDGDDVIYGQRAGILIGGFGNDSYEVTISNQIVFEFGSAGNSVSGSDKVFAYVDFTLPDHVENLIMIYGQQTYGYGNGGDNIIIGNAANNVLEGKGGYDTLTGGAGSDLFVVNRNWGVDVITDFVAGAGTEDAVLLPAQLFLNFAGVMAKSRQMGSDVWIDDGLGNTVVLSNVTIGSLHPDDFGFI